MSTSTQKPRQKRRLHDHINGPFFCQGPTNRRACLISRDQNLVCRKSDLAVKERTCLLHRKSIPGFLAEGSVISECALAVYRMRGSDSNGTSARPRGMAPCALVMTVLHTAPASERRTVLVVTYSEESPRLQEDLVLPRPDLRTPPPDCCVYVTGQTSIQDNPRLS